jgi:long-chain acyl-CoA synthetase
MSWNEWARASRELAGGLRSLGLSPGDRVCLLANSRPEWFLFDVAILMAGAVTVPIYQSNTAEQCEYIITDCGARLVVAENPAQIEKLFAPEARVRLAGLSRIAYFDARSALEKPKDGKREQLLEDVVPAEARGKLVSVGDLRERGRAWLAEHDGALERTWADLHPDSVFTIVYTSGTTGPPKGVVLQHSSVVFECQGLSVLSVGESDEQLLFLPLAHIFAKLLEWKAIHSGAVTTFARSFAALRSDLSEVRPTFMGGVPRVFEKLYAGIQATVKDSPPLRQKIFRWASAVGAEVSRRRQSEKPLGAWLALRHRIASRLVFSKLKRKLGLDRIRVMISGGAPLAREIAEFFHSIDILILEGYGLTETTGATHINRLERFRLGTVGPALPGIEVRIAEDGEILVRGGNILKEYYKKPEATREVLEPDGWFHTGDIGVIEDGLLRITDRKKDLIVTAGGKNVAPQNIEGALKAASAYISQVMVHGDKRNFLSALITLNEEAVVKWASAQGITSGGGEGLGGHDAVRKLVQGAVDQVNAGLPSYETIKKFAILPRDFSQETGELTPTLKVKRKFTTEKYQGILDGFYANGAGKSA